MLCAACALTVQAADTLRVERADVLAAFSFPRPYATDTVDAKGKAFDVEEYVKNNPPARFAGATPVGRVSRGEALAADDAGTLRVLRFTLTAPRYVEATLRVQGMKHYKAYVDDRELPSDGKLTLTPGRAEVALVSLAVPEAKDSFDVMLTGDALTSLKLNDESKRPYTMGEMMWGDHYASVALSPSGKYLVTRYYYTKKDGSNLWRTVVTETKTQREVLRRSDAPDFRWMARRDVLCYTRDGALGKQLVELDPATGRESVLFEALPSTGFTLSPTEDYLVYARTEGGRKDKGSLKRLVEPDDRQPGWRNRSALFRLDLKTGAVRRLTFGSRSVWLADISRDGKRLLLQYNDMQPSKQPFQRSTFVAMDAYTGAVDTLLADTTFISSARFAPDGRRLLVQASGAAFDGVGSRIRPGQIASVFDNRLYLYDPDARSVRALMPDFKPSVGSYRWSDADGLIYFKATDGSDESLFSLDPETGKITAFRLPVTYVQGYDIARTGRPLAVVFGQTGERARDMYLCTLDKAEPSVRRIGEIDFDAMAAGLAIGTCHDWTFRSSRGDTIDGFYFLPPGFDASKRYPMIVYYYGGCTPTPRLLEFQYPFQVLAGQGYVVYVVEPSGATGYGQEFAARHVGTWGRGSADDIIEGTQAFLKAHPFVDPAKVGCMGASYGGFMTEYLQTRTDIFAAAVSHAGISNIASYWGGGYWGFTYGEGAQYGSYPWNNPELYVEQSPLFHADKIHTPLLLMHGTVDTNVPTTESIQLFTALRILGRPVSFVTVDGENHVIVNYNKRLEWQNAIFAWFAHWLKDEPEWWKALYPDDTFGLGPEALEKQRKK